MCPHGLGLGHLLADVIVLVISSIPFVRLMIKKRG